MKPLHSRIANLDIELTERCNNRCIHCYINQPEEDIVLKEREMDTSFIQDILQQAVDLDCLTVRFTGGEPLLREDFVQLYQFARRLGLKVRISTNARLISPELAELFASIPPGQPIEVSVYGMQACSYDTVTAVKGAYEQFRQGLNLLQAKQIPFIVTQSLLPQNRGELPEFETFTATLPHQNKNPAYTMNFDLRSRRDDEHKNHLIRSLRVSPEETIAILTSDPARYIKEMRIFAVKFLGSTGDKLFNCGAGLRASVDAYGYIQMCTLLRHPDTIYPLDPVYQQRTKPYKKLLPMEYALSEFFPKIRKLRSSNREYLLRCAVCFLKNLCEQCPAKSWEEHGTLDTPVEYFCELTHAKAVYIGLVLEGEKSWEIIPEIWKKRLKVFTNTLKS